MPTKDKVTGNEWSQTVTVTAHIAHLLIKEHS